VPPCVIFEDDHLLVVNKPPGLNTHSPSPYAGEGLYEWLRHREPRWGELAIIQRLDKETSGVMVFAKTRLANRLLTEQFTNRTVRKKYVLLTDRDVRQKELTVKSSLVRAGEKYVGRPVHAGAEVAETRFKIQLPESKSQNISRPASFSSCTVIEVEPLTGRTHQIRVHAAEKGFPILGDTLYGGSSASRLCLHAAEITLMHPATKREMTFAASADFDADPRAQLRAALIEPELTDAYRLIHGASDGWPDWYVDRLGDFLLSQGEQALSAAEEQELLRVMKGVGACGAYHKLLTRRLRQTTLAQTSPQHVLGEPAPERFTIRENGIPFELSFSEGYSVGLFLDQRENRRRLLTGHIAAGFEVGQASRLSYPPEVGIADRRDAFPTLLNAFAYTCGFSICAAKAGARTTSLDLSKKYLEWGKRNFGLNQINSAEHDFIFGEVFDWLGRLAKKWRVFDVVVLDPPTFSQSRNFGAFRAEKKFGQLVNAALPLVKTGGVLFASSNAADWAPEKFLASIELAIHAGKRKIVQKHYVPQPPDFPISRAEPGYLKTIWLRIG
jgi:23S rRNA (cytosine1962-C5)-methyltransferase